MTVEVFIPGFGFDVINLDILRLQPWNYLLQIAKNLIKQGYRIVITIIDAKTTREVEDLLAKESIKVQPFNKHRIADTVIIPIAVGFLSRLINMLACNKRREIVGVLTTPLIDIYTLWINYVRIKISRTGVTADTLLRENVLFRLRGSLVCNHVKKLIVPSNDYSKLLFNILPCEIETIAFIPHVIVPTFNDAVVKEVRLNYEDKGKVVSYFGPFSEERGVISLIKAFKKLRYSSIKLQLLIRDIGSKRIDLLNKMLAKDSGNVITYIGNMSKEELFNKLVMSDLIVLPYRIIPSTIPLAYLGRSC